ncbi:unnamed protein product [Closterium sp. NIES-54]
MRENRVGNRVSRMPPTMPATVALPPPRDTPSVGCRGVAAGVRGGSRFPLVSSRRARGRSAKKEQRHHSSRSAARSFQRRLRYSRRPLPVQLRAASV